MLLLAFSLSSAQAKKWTLAECVGYALEHNISIKQTDLDNRSAAIDKKAATGNFLPSINADASHSWNIGLNQNITTGLLENMLFPSPDYIVLSNANMLAITQMR